ncbi:hypothetical protein [Microbacterium testaceum]|uniref:hypothetical protein n=1 Tax=Microbacterium testaceum TaxID=2033 RepID=UPI00130544CF|nr:hypothetical protein [Microbacterium testaceum]
MGWFGRRPKAAQPVDRVEWVVATARQAFAQRGVESTIEHGPAPEDVTLFADGRRFPLYNLLVKTDGLTLSEAEKVIDAHVRSLAHEPSIFDPTPDELRSMIRTRLISNQNVRPDEPSFDYARPFADGVVVALCLDLPETVQTISDAGIATAGWDLDELYRWGQENTDRESVDERDVLETGVHILAGESFFVASKATNLPRAVPVTEFGTVFAIPHRHMLLALPLSRRDPVDGIHHVAAIMQRIVRDPLPGGLISRDLFFARDGLVSRVSETDAEGTVSLLVDGPFQSALEEVVEGDSSEGVSG